MELRLGGEDYALFMNLGEFWKLLRFSWRPNPQASLNEKTTERIKLSPGKDEDQGILNVINKLILPRLEEFKTNG